MKKNKNMQSDKTVTNCSKVSSNSNNKNVGFNKQNTIKNDESHSFELDENSEHSFELRD